MRRLLIAALIVTCQTASAQSPIYPEAGPNRVGLEWGIGLSLGSLQADCSDCRQTFEAGGLDGHVGWMLAPHMALAGDLWIMAHTEGFLTVYQNLLTATFTYWATPRFWLQAGFGLATAGYSWRGIYANFQDQTESKPGILLGIGYEVHQRGNFTIDIRLRWGTGFYSGQVANEYVVKAHSVGLGVSFNWF